jgi:hypothetical protein
VMDVVEAQRRAEIWLQDLWAGRETAEFALPPSALAFEPGDVVGLTVNGRRHLLELREFVDTESRRITAGSIDSEIFGLALPAPLSRTPALPAAIGPVHALLLDLPTVDASDPPVLLRAAVFADPWPGPVAIWRSTDGSTFSRAALAIAPSIVGETLDDLPAGPTGRWDRGAGTRVQLYGGALASVSDATVFGGVNAAAVQRADGAWEIIQFANAELVGDKTYRLTRLLRGQAGSEWAMVDPLAAGAPFVVLDQNIVPVARGLDALGRTLQLRIVAADRNHGDPLAVALSATPQATALRPLSPVQLRAARTGSGVSVSWIRRTRRDGDSWDASDVPLGEDREAYETDILSGSTVVRTLASTQPAVTYAAADELADFGAPQTSLTVRIAQMSATVGRGIAAQATLTV